LVVEEIEGPPSLEDDLAEARFYVSARKRRVIFTALFLMLIGLPIQSVQRNIAVDAGDYSRQAFAPILCIALLALVAMVHKRKREEGDVHKPRRTYQVDDGSPRCLTCGKALHKPLRCRRCGENFCQAHSSPSKHECTGEVPTSITRRGALVIILVLAVILSGYYLLTEKPVDLPEAGMPLANPTMLNSKWTLDLTSFNMTQSHHSSPTVADVDGDGENEILLAYRRPWGGCDVEPYYGENRLLCASSAGEVEWIFPPLNQSEMWGHPMSNPTIADLDGDGDLEILLGRRGTGENCGALLCVDGKGVEVWNFTMGEVMGAVIAEPQVYDNDRDGIHEIYVASGKSPYGFDQFSGRVTCLDPNGEMIWNVEIPGHAEWAPIVWDINLDGNGEIILCLNSNQLLCLDAGDGGKIWSRNIPSEEGRMESAPVAADVDMDGKYELLVADANGDFHIFGPKGERLWRFRTPTEGSIKFSFPVADIDDDSHLETVFMDDELLYCIDLYDRSIEWTFMPETPDHYSNYNTFADVTGDGRIDVLVVAPSLYVLSSKGEHLVSFDTAKLHRNDRALNGMWSGDLDGDGMVEILVKFEGDGLFCLETGSLYVEENMPWPKPLGNPENRAVIPMGD
jgi:outer membrane protein assembly factor BamB